MFIELTLGFLGILREELYPCYDMLSPDLKMRFYRWRFKFEEIKIIIKQKERSILAFICLVISMQINENDKLKRHPVTHTEE